MEKHTKKSHEAHSFFSFRLKKELLVALLFCLSSSIVAQQTITVKGIVKDPSGETLIGAGVNIENTTIGTITDVDGQFTIHAPLNATLVFTYIGYQPQKRKVEGDKLLIVTMQEDTQLIDDVVVIAYGVQKKESVVGAISQVNSSDLMRAGTSTLSNSMAGRVPGMVTVQQTGMPGASEPQIFIRGLSSFSGNNQPLVLVDGIERPLSDIDASEVESVSVLKDASATAVYGVKGGNGVILVTTKRGQEGRMEISVSYEQTLKQPSNKGVLEDSYTTLYGRDMIYRNQNKYNQVLGDEILDRYRNPRDIYDPYIYPNVDAWKEGTRKAAFDTRVSVSARGGTKTAKYFLTLSYLHEGDLLKSDQDLYNSNFEYNRINYRMNFDFDFTKTTKVSVSSGGFVGTVNSPGNIGAADGPKILSALYTQAPYVTPNIYPAFFLEKYPDLKNPGTGDRVAGNLNSPGALTSYYKQNYNGSTRTVRDRFGIDLSVEQKLDFLTKGLSLKANFSYNNYSTWTGGNTIYSGESYLFSLTGDSYTWTRFIGGSENLYDEVKDPYQEPLKRSGNPSYDYVYNVWLNYNRQFGDHTVTGLALFERRFNYIGAQFPRREEKWSARATYDFRTKYMLEATLGVTGSERFAPVNRFGYFPSIAVGWNIAKEELFRRYVPEQISNLKARYSYGESGNDNVSAILFISDFTNNTGYNLGAPGTSYWVNSIVEGAVPNEKARWERAKKHNFGIDVGFFENSLMFTAEFFSEKRDGILMGRRSLASWFGQSVKELNIGSVERHGYELELSYFGKVGHTFDYWVKANYNFNENRITNQDDPFLTPDYLKYEGMPINQIKTYQHIGYYQNMDEILNYSLGRDLGLLPLGSDKYLDFNGTGTLDSDDRVPVYGSTRPTTTFSLSGGLEYRNFEMSFLIQGATNVYRNLGHTYAPYYTVDPGERIQYIKIRNRDDIWSPANRDAEYATWGGWEEAGSNAVVNGKYVRLKSMEVAYSFTGKTLQKVGLSSARVALQGANLLTWAPGYTAGGDPETESSYVNGVDYAPYPLPRRFTLALKINF